MKNEVSVVSLEKVTLEPVISYELKELIKRGNSMSSF